MLIYPAVMEENLYVSKQAGKQNSHSSPAFKVLKNGFENNLIAPAEGDVGWDLVASTIPHLIYDRKSKSLKPMYIEYDTGVVIQPPTNCFSLVFPRSSISNYQLALANSVGVIDSGYRASIKLRFRYFGKTVPEFDKIYKMGDKIGQLVFMPAVKPELFVAESLDESLRGKAGFGSTGV